MAKKAAMPKKPAMSKPKSMPKSMGGGGKKGKPSVAKNSTMDKGGKPTY